MATYRAIAVPQVIRKPIGGEGFKSKSGSRFDEALRSRAGGERERVGGDIKGDAGRAIKRNKLDELLNEIAPGTKLSDEVAEFVYDYIDEWIESVTRGACLLAKHRHSDRLEVRDLQLYLDKTWNIKIPGFGSDEIKYVGRLAAVKEALKGKEKAK
ncbi:hypothetical protein BT69DRAFT_512507 [Atractiella rhizophila]|nr:hypothetical protein BT69DRAFT_512507 [Atractiella rhizophila]